MPAAPAEEQKEGAGLLRAWARGVTATLVVVMRGMMCGRQSGAYVVFGCEEQQQQGRSLAAKVLGPQLQLFQDTNELLMRTLFSKSDLAPASSSFQQVSSRSCSLRMLMASMRVSSCVSTHAACYGNGWWESSYLREQWTGGPIR